MPVALTSSARLRPAALGTCHPAFGLDAVSLGYNGSPVVAGISGQFPQGSLTAIVGPNGGGKTTLLKGLLGLVKVQGGAIKAQHARNEMAYLPQASEVDAGFPVTVEDFVSTGLWASIGGLRKVKPSMSHLVSEALQALGLHGCATRWMDELSGGQFQRMRFARLVVQDAPVILLDEPFTGIDEETTQALLKLIVNWHAKGKTVIAVLHDLDVVRSHFPHTLAVAGHVLAWGDTPGTLAALAGARSSP